MLPLSLRRRSDPGALSPASEGPPTIESRNHGSSFSISAKSSPASSAGLPVNSQTSHEARSVECLEKANHPVYDSKDLEHNPGSKYEVETRSPDQFSTPSKLSRKRSRSSTRLRSPSGPKGFLNSLADSMRTVAEFFHKQPGPPKSNNNEQEEQHTPRTSPVRHFRTVKSGSPRKSVRFRSQTYTCGENQSSPIDIPQKIAPSLPPIDIPKPTFGTFITNNDPIPTARPPETPFLKARDAQDLFEERGLPVPMATSSGENQAKIPSGLQSPLPGTNMGMDDPFGDTAVMNKGSVKSQNLVPTKSPTNPAAPSQAGQLETSSGRHRGANMVQTPATTFDRCLGGRKLSDTSAALNSGLQVKEHILDSQWTLESRDMAGDKTRERTDDDGASDESEASELGQSSLLDRSKQAPVHLGLLSKEARAGWATKGLSSSPPLPKAPADIVDHDGYSKQELKEQYDTTVKDFPILHISDVEPGKQECGIVRSTGQQESPGRLTIIPQDSVSPLNLKATVSSTSPPRKRKPFRFSNRAETQAQANAEVVRATSFSAAAKASEAERKDSPPAARTPSPTLVPLPLSLAPAKLDERDLTWQDEFGWCPFDSKLFPRVFLATPDFHYLLKEEGGFFRFWRDFVLAVDESAVGPRRVTRPLSQTEIEFLEFHSLRKKCHLTSAELEQVAAIASMAKKSSMKESKDRTETIAELEGEDQTNEANPLCGSQPQEVPNTSDEQNPSHHTEKPPPQKPVAIQKELPPLEVKKTLSLLPACFSSSIGSSTNHYSPLQSHKQHYSGEISTACSSFVSLPATTKPLDEELEGALPNLDAFRSEGPAPSTACLEPDCELCKSVRGSEDSDVFLKDSHDHEDLSDGATDDNVNELALLMDTTPTRHSRHDFEGERQVSPERTPRQKDFGSLKVSRLPIRKKRCFAKTGSEESMASMTTQTTLSTNSEDERYARGII